MVLPDPATPTTRSTRRPDSQMPITATACPWVSGRPSSASFRSMAASTPSAGTTAEPVCGRPSGDVGGDGRLDGDHRRAGVGPLRGARHTDERHDLPVGPDEIDDGVQLGGVPAEQGRRHGDDHVPSAEHLPRRQRTTRAHRPVDDPAELVVGQDRSRRRPAGGGPFDASDQVDGVQADPLQLRLPADHQILHRRVPFRRAGGAGGDSPGPVAVKARLGHGVVDLRRPLGEQLLRLHRHARDAPLA